MRLVLPVKSTASADWKPAKSKDELVYYTREALFIVCLISSSG